MLRNTEDAVVTISSDVQNDSKFALKNEVNDFSSQITVIENDMTEISAKTGYLLSAVTETWFDENQNTIPEVINDISTQVIGFGNRISDLEEYDHVGKVYPGSTSGEVFNDYANNEASGAYSHAEGNSTSAIGEYSHTEGFHTTAEGIASHAEGYSTSATGPYSHAEGRYNLAKGYYSHAEGYYTQTNGAYEHACGSYNLSTTAASITARTLFSIGVGSSSSARKNAIEVKSNGDVYIYGIGGYDGRNSPGNSAYTSSVKSVGDAIPKFVVTSALPSTLASDTIYFIY